MTIHPQMRNIEWAQKSWNPITGCNGPNGVRCPWCYAHVCAKRLRGRYGYPEDDPFRPTFHPDKLKVPLKRKKPTIWFHGSMCDWLDPAVEADWRRQVLEVMNIAKNHIFITLTQQYKDLWKIPYDSPEGFVPPNVWVGVSVTDRSKVWGIRELGKIEAPKRLASFEPYLEDISNIVDFHSLDWAIIGARSKQGKIPYFRPEKKWVQRLVYKAKTFWVTEHDEMPIGYDRNGVLTIYDGVKIPVFLKPNLGDYVKEGWFNKKLEEMPRW